MQLTAMLCTLTLNVHDHAVYWQKTGDTIHIMRQGLRFDILQYLYDILRYTEIFFLNLTLGKLS